MNLCLSPRTFVANRIYPHRHSAFNRAPMNFFIPTFSPKTNTEAIDPQMSGKIDSQGFRILSS